MSNYFNFPLPNGKSILVTGTGEAIFGVDTFLGLTDAEIARAISSVSSDLDLLATYCDHTYYTHCSTLKEAKQYAKKTKRRSETKRVKKKLIRQRRSEFVSKRADLMLALIDRDGYICNECDCQSDLTIDHITPLSKGGSDDLENLQLLCKSCNSIKGDRIR